MRIIGIVAAITAMMVAVGKNLAHMIDPAALIVVVGGIVALLLLGGSSIPTMIRGIVPGSMSEGEVRVAAHGWKMTRFYALGMGVVGTLIGWILMLANLDDPAAIGPGMAIALSTIFYGLILAFLISLPLQCNLQKQLSDAEDGSITSTGVLGGLLALLALMVTFGTLLVALG